MANIVLFEDKAVANMNPITLTRPAFLVSCAGYNLYDIVKELGGNIAYVIRPYLSNLTARKVEQQSLQDGPTLYLNASLAPDIRYQELIRELLAADTPFMFTSGQRICAAFTPNPLDLPEETSADTVASLLLEEKLPLRQDVDLKLFDYPFHVVDELPKIFSGNQEAKIRKGVYRETSPGVFVSDGVTIADTAVLHAENGPIVLDDHVQVMDFCYLKGPLMIGSHSRIIERSSIKEYTSIGKTCKIGGEVEASIIEDFANKQHHGFLGHSYVGSWVNLGAGTSNSDLKNTYGPVRINQDKKKIDTGMQFFGCVIGDFSKSAINTSIFTGKIIGVNSMLYGYIGQNVPSFCNYAASFGQITECSLKQALNTQKRMYARRDIDQSNEDIELLTTLFHLTSKERTFSNEPPAL